jgi:hypothetical protein
VALFRHYCSTVAEWVFTILTLVRRPPWTIKGEVGITNRGGEHAHTNTARQKQHTTLTEQQLLLLTYIDLGPLPSLDLSLYPLLQAPLWAYRTFFRTGRRASPRCLNQYNPGVSKPNHLDQTHDSNQKLLSMVSNPDRDPHSNILKRGNVYKAIRGTT